MHYHFPLFQSHLDLAHHYWKLIAKRGDIVIDATCGNGQDTRYLSQLVLDDSNGEVWAVDVQKTAIEKAKLFLEQNLSPSICNRVKYYYGCHSTFPKQILPKSIALVVYNLGYLPGGDKQLTTKVETTLKSIEKALSLVKNGGAISITCYPGHNEGAIEETALLDFFKSLSAKTWSCCHHQWLNRKNSPSLLFIQKKAIHHI